MSSNNKKSSVSEFLKREDPNLASLKKKYFKEANLTNESAASPEI